MNTKLKIFLLVCFVSGIFCNPNHERERRQLQIDQGVNQSPTPTPGTTTTTASPRYRACLSACLTTQEYNPVCGSDGVTYNNPGRLRCAVRCGNNIRQAFGAACQPVS